MSFRRTARPRTTELNLGNGTLLLRPDGSPAFRDVGNCSAFSVSSETESVQLPNRQDFSAGTYAEAIQSSTTTITASLDNINDFENLGIILQALLENLEDAQDRYAVDGVQIPFAYNFMTLLNIGGTHARVDIPNASVVRNKWYPLTGLRVRTDGGAFVGSLPQEANLYAYQLDKTTAGATAYTVPTLELPGGVAGPQVQVWFSTNGGSSYTQGNLGTDYDIDYEMGMVLLRGAGSQANWTASNVQYRIIVMPDRAGLAARIIGRDVVKSFAGEQFQGEALFIAENRQDGRIKCWFFHNISLRADGELGLIADDFSSVQLTGTASSSTSPVLVAAGSRVATVIDIGLPEFDD